MAGMQFEYDEKGGTFYYFLLSFLALILIPATYYLWPRKTSKDREDEDSDRKNKRECHCDPCQMKKQLIRSNEPWVKMKRTSIKISLLLGWVLFVVVAYKTSQVELDFSEFDPFAELGIDRGAGGSEIRKAYHKLSLRYHPDKTDGDPQRFMRITKAYQALTDEEAKKNWEIYGNPDGPGATHFGIALPKWIVEKQNSVWVLAAYVLVFMVLLPTVVGTWWYRSIKYSAEQVLMDTTQLYYYFFHKTPNMNLQRVIMILGASMEYNKLQNGEIIERPSDNEEIPMLMRDLQHLNEKNKEKPLCFPYSIKARALIQAHFQRLELPPKTLELDRRYIITKCTYLINEMVTIVAQLVALAHHGRAVHKPRLETIENCMRVSQMVVQALTHCVKSPLLQLPHISEDMLRHFNTRRRHIRTIQQFVQMNAEERRQLLRSLTDNEYADVMNVCRTLPFVTMTVSTEVLDDDDKTVTAGSIVTVTVKLVRESMEVLFENEHNEVANEELEEDHEEAEDETPTTDSPLRKAAAPKVWEKQKKKKGGKGKKGGKKPVKPANKKPVGGTPGSIVSADAKDSVKDSPQPNGTVEKPKRVKLKREEDASTDDESAEESDADGEPSEGEDAADVPEDDEDDWRKFQEEAKKENILETKSKETHIVHCPHYPGVKYEWWWTYVADRKQHILITAPAQITSLKDEEEIQLKFSAPPKPGMYEYSVILRSDSYMLEFDRITKIKLDVKEARKVESHPQWDMSEDDDEDKADADLTETEDDSYDDSDDE